MTKNVLLLSSSVVHGGGYLEYAAEHILKFLSGNNVSKIMFIPYAAHDHDAYALKVKTAFSKWGIGVESIHTFENKVAAVGEAQAFFVGGGNTFMLLNNLYKLNLIDPIKKRVLQDGVPYMGASAGTNVATINICTTNDMPIVFPPSFDAFGFVPFNINPHYQDPDPNSTHMGETRETRISEYHGNPNTPPVLGLREGSLLDVQGDHIQLKGSPSSARLFVRGQPPKELERNSDLSFLLK